MAQRMPLDRPLTIVTNSLPVATTLAERTNIQVIILGGRVRGSTMGVVDQWPTQMLSGLVIDLAIIGANGITLEHGMTTPGPAVAAVKAAAAAPYILAGHSIDIPFFFNNLGAPYVREYTGPNPRRNSPTSTTTPSPRSPPPATPAGPPSSPTPPS